MKKNFGLVAVLALVLGLASAFGTSTKTARVDNCPAEDISDLCPNPQQTACCIAVSGTTRGTQSIPAGTTVFKNN